MMWWWYWCWLTASFIFFMMHRTTTTIMIGTTCEENKIGRNRIGVDLTDWLTNKQTDTIDRNITTSNLERKKKNKKKMKNVNVNNGCNCCWYRRQMLNSTFKFNSQSSELFPFKRTADRKQHICFVNTYKNVDRSNFYTIEKNRYAFAFYIW